MTVIGRGVETVIGHERVFSPAFETVRCNPVDIDGRALGIDRRRSEMKSLAVLRQRQGLSWPLSSRSGGEALDQGPGRNIVT